MQLELKDKELFDQAFSCLNAPVSDYTFANTFIWREALKMTWAYIEGHQCVFTEVEGDLRMALPPIGEGDLERCLKTCYEIMDDYNAPYRRHVTQRDRVRQRRTARAVHRPGVYPGSDRRRLRL